MNSALLLALRIRLARYFLMARIPVIIAAAFSIIWIVLGLRCLGKTHYIHLHANITPELNEMDKTSLLAQMLHWLRERSRHGIVHVLFASFMVIVVSELCDKTFFIAAILSMKYKRLVVYCGAMSALALMTVISALLGNVVTSIISPRVTHYASTLLFGLFGLKMLFEGIRMDANDCSDEYEEAQMEVASKDPEKTLLTKTSQSYNDIEKGVDPVGDTCPYRGREWMIITCQAFVMTFLAEWGDRSQVTTIVLAAKERTEVIWVIVGSCMGHAFCTGLAVLGGKVLANKISVRTITLLGAFVFIAFTISSIFFIPLEVI